MAKQKVEVDQDQLGRPPAFTRERIWQAAMELFLEQGYAQTNLEQVAKRAGVTKPTVYSHFDSKPNLFNSVVRGCAQQRLGQIAQLEDPSGDPRQDLTQFGNTFLDLVLAPDAQRWDRLAASESMKHPEVGAMFYQAGPKQLLDRLSGYLAKQKKAGRLNPPRPAVAAEQLIGLLVGVDILRSLIGQAPPTRAQRRKRCREAVDVFLAAYEVTS